MKREVFIIFICLVSFVSVQSQNSLLEDTEWIYDFDNYFFGNAECSLDFNNWFPDNAEWTYDYNSADAKGYVLIKKVSDTIIYNESGQPINCKVLEKTRHTYNYLQNVYNDEDLGHEYVYADEDKVYIYKNEQFYTLYDFSAEIGDTWVIPAMEDYNDETMFSCDEGIVKVIGKGVVIDHPIFQGLRYIVLQTEANDTWQLWGTIMELIGSTRWYMFPEQGCVSDVSEGGPLRCYMGDGMMLDTGISWSCYHIVFGTEDIEKERISIYPNPTFDKFTFNGASSKVYNITVKNVNGQMVKNIRQVMNGNVINVSNLPTGLYLLMISNEKEKYYTKFIKL